MMWFTLHGRSLRDTDLGWCRLVLAPCLVACLCLASPAALSQAADFAQVKQAFDQQRYEPAREGFEQLAEAGDPRAMFYLGVIHNQGLGAAVDLQQAFGWYEKSAKLGHAVAQYNLGNAFKHGRGTAKSEELAVFWWEKAAQQGQANAQYNVALQYYLGLGVDKNMDKALHYFHEAADRGHPKAVALIAEGKVPARKQAPGATAAAVNSPPAPSPAPTQPRATATAVATAPGNDVAAMAAQRQAPLPPASAPQPLPAAVVPAKPAAVPSALDWAPVRQNESAGSIPATSSAPAPRQLPAPERGKSILPAPGSKLSLSDWTPVRMDKPVDTFGVGSTFGGGGGVQSGGVPSVPSTARTWGQGASAPSITALPVPQADITVTNSGGAQAVPAAVAQNSQPPAAPFKIVDTSAGLPPTAVAPSPVRTAPQPAASAAPMSAPPAGAADQDRARLPAPAPAARPPQGAGQAVVIQPAAAQGKSGMPSPARGPATPPKAARLPPIEQTPELAPPPAPPALVAPVKKVADSIPATAKPRQVALASGKPAPVQPPPQVKPSAQAPSAAQPPQRPVARVNQPAAPASSEADEPRQNPPLNAVPTPAQPPQPAPVPAAKQAVATLQPGTSSPAVPPAALAVLDRTWLMAQKPSDCTIQLAVMSNTASLESFLDSYSLQGRVKVLEVVAAQQKRYHVLLGNYPDLATAETRIHSLDTSLQLLKPWARCYAALAAIPAQ